MIKKKIDETCKVFVQNRLDEIQELMNSGYSLLDLFNYYQDKYELKWRDYPTFGVHIRKSGLCFSDDALKIISKKRYIKASKTKIDKRPEEKAAIYKKFKKTLDSQTSEYKLSYISKREFTKANYTPEQKQHRIDAMNETKRKNNSFNTSKPQDMLKEYLIQMFGYENVLTEYRAVRYPFSCDFYIKSEDLFIELNGHFTHGPHRFDENNPNDILLLDDLRNKAAEARSRNDHKRSLYDVEIKVWTVSDPNKIKTAINNNIKLIVIYPKGIVYKYNTEFNLDFNI